MDTTLDQTTLATISLLESRLLRIEHILYGPTAPPTEPPSQSAISSLAELEYRFNQLVKHVRVYAEILKIYKSHPSLFPSSNSLSSPSEPPTLLPPAAVLATVLSYASAFPSTASALTAATSDEPIPDASQSALLASLAPRMRAVEALQAAQAAEIAELRERSERAVKAWYARGVLGYGEEIAALEKRMGEVERGVRRELRRREQEEKV
ncbi:hypothetical protein VTK26DRAFT_2820 [Humicola hyalothermophila]